MTHEYILTTLERAPRTERSFTHGNARIGPVIESLISQGLIERDGSDLFITPAGEARVTAMRMPTGPGPKPTEPYRPTSWDVRQGADDNKRYRSRGV